VPFIITQQVQPDFMHIIMQSQHAWIIAQQSLSPLVQVIVQPSLVISTLHRPIARLQQQQTTPFITMQQLIMPPCIIMQRFCIMAQEAWSGQVQLIFIPPSHFSIFMEQRGTISQLVGAIIPGIIGLVAPGIPGIIAPIRSIVIAPVMILSS